MQALITRGDLDGFFTPATVSRVFSDSGGRDAGPRLEAAILAGSDEAAAILGVVWMTEEQIIELVANDSGARLAVCRLVMAIGADSNPAWFAGDQGPGEKWRRDARATLGDLVKRKTRSPAEAQAGANTTTYPRVQQRTPAFEFATHRGRTPRGGF